LAYSAGLAERDQRRRHRREGRDDQQQGPGDGIEEPGGELRGEREAQGLLVQARAGKSPFDRIDGAEQGDLAGDSPKDPEGQQQGRLGQRADPSLPPEPAHGRREHAPIFLLRLIDEAEPGADREQQTEAGERRQPPPDRGRLRRGGIRNYGYRRHRAIIGRAGAVPQALR